MRKLKTYLETGFLLVYLTLMMFPYGLLDEYRLLRLVKAGYANEREINSDVIREQLDA